MKRRDFLKAATAVSAMAGLGTSIRPALAADTAGTSAREIYELRFYRTKEGSDHALLNNYLAAAMIPALNRLGLSPVGVFTEPEAKDGLGVYVLIPYPSLEVFSTAAERFSADSGYLKEGSEYLSVAKANAAFVRMDSWLMRAFVGLPKISLPSYSKEKKARIFELRTYESFSEAKAQNKVDMFNAGEIDAMKEVGLAPIFYGQSLVGRDLPNLMYMTSAENRELHKEHWNAFNTHPAWKKLTGDKHYSDNVSKITSRFLVPLEGSQI